MTDTVVKPLTGRKVALIFCGAFAIIIGVNLTLAYKAVATFPGLEVKNSYVASQNFDRDKAAQVALGWDVSATLENGQLRLSILADGTPVEPRIDYAVLGRATNVAQDVTPDWKFDGQAFVAPVTLGAGNWNLRIVATADNGVEFKQRIIVKVIK